MRCSPPHFFFAEAVPCTCSGRRFIFWYMYPTCTCTYSGRGFFFWSGTLPAPVLALVGNIFWVQEVPVPVSLFLVLVPNTYLYIYGGQRVPQNKPCRNMYVYRGQYVPKKISTGTSTVLQNFLLKKVLFTSHTGLPPSPAFFSRRLYVVPRSPI